MLQTKFVLGVDVPDLEQSLNAALTKIASENIKVNYFLDNLTAIVEYEVLEAYKQRLCCECSFWDDGGATSSLSGFCTMTGKRLRYNCKACSHYTDVRG